MFSLCFFEKSDPSGILDNMAERMFSCTEHDAILLSSGLTTALFVAFIAEGGRRVPLLWRVAGLTVGCFYPAMVWPFSTIQRLLGGER
jgi:hypothetical protein